MGPGSYNGEIKFYKPSQPFFGRQGVSSVRHRASPRGGSTSIRGNYDDDSDEEENTLASKIRTPGPGQYMTQDSTFINRVRPNSLQLFGSGVKRFADTHNDSGLGPGQYRTRNPAQMKYNSVLRAAGSASFKSPKRTDQLTGNSFDLPGPGDYTGHQIH